MRLLNLLWLFILAGLFFHCQTSVEIMPITINHPYKFPAEIETTLRNDTTPWKYEPASWAYSQIGDFDNTLIQWDSSRKMVAKNFGIFLNTDSIDVDVVKNKFQPKDAKSVILEKAANHQILLINEGHHLPNNRVFTRSLLADLWKLGYRHLGLEAINFDLEMMHQKGYPTYDAGFYTKEAQFGELIRTALDLGFHIFGYDPNDVYDEEREIQQATNIKAVVDNFPNDKVLIHCGFGHHDENPNNRLMGFHLAQLTNTNPLTVNQYYYSERHSPYYEHPVYTELVTPTSVVFTTAEGKDFHRPTADSINEDILVFHPRTTYKYGRPIWLEDEQKRITKVELPDFQINCPCLVFAIPENELATEAVPVDVVSIDNGEKEVYLALEKGTYQIVVQPQNKEGVLFNFKNF